MFPAVWYAYNPGSLLSAGVTSVVSKGKNLADYSGGVGVPSNTSSSATAKRTFEIGKYIVGLATNNYYYPSQVTSYSVDDSGISLITSGTAYGISVPFLCEAGKPYTISCTITNGNITMSWYSKDGTFLQGESATTTSPKTATAPSNAYYGVAYFRATTANTTATFTNIQIEQSATATTYSAPFTISTPIPAEVQALEGYGWSAGSVYNYIDYERKVFVKNVDRVDLGTLGYASSSSSGHRYFFSGGLLNVIKYVAGTNSAVNNIVCDKYIAGSFLNAYNGTFDCIGVGGHLINTGRIAIFDSTKEEMTSAEFKASVSGVYAYYELATPIETDISAYLSDDNLIEVEAGGTLTFPNSNGDDYRIPVPSAETYMVDLQSAI
jgi:hypothetical protein